MTKVFEKLDDIDMNGSKQLGEDKDLDVNSGYELW